MNKGKLNKLLQTIKTKARKLLYKHNIDNEEYIRLMLNNLIFNDKTRMVAIFKEHLIRNDSSEFLRRYDDE
jgi:hypothetical protein